MTTCREFFTFSWPLRGRGRGGRPKRSAWPLYRRFFFWILPLQIILPILLNQNHLHHEQDYHKTRKLDTITIIKSIKISTMHWWLQVKYLVSRVAQWLSDSRADWRSNFFRPQRQRFPFLKLVLLQSFEIYPDPQRTFMVACENDYLCMFRRPPFLSTRGEDTYDYLADDLDQQVLSFLSKQG